MNDSLKVIAAAIVIGSHCPVAEAPLAFYGEPINYGAADTDDPIAQLQEQPDAGETRLGYEQQRGYLPALLELLDKQSATEPPAKTIVS